MLVTFDPVASSQRPDKYNLKLFRSALTIMSRSQFPHPNGMPTFWTDGDGDIDNIRSTDHLPSESAIVIIGGGYSAASLVTHILDSYPKHPSVVVIEARQLCSGATGRNGNQEASPNSSPSHQKMRRGSLIPMNLPRRPSEA